jgi:hypothetical protein
MRSCSRDKNKEKCLGKHGSSYFFSDCPTRSLDLNLLDFYLCDHLKCIVYAKVKKAKQSHNTPVEAQGRRGCIDPTHS